MVELAFAISLAGLLASSILIGNLSTFVGLPMKVEFPMWMLFYALWAVLASVGGWLEFGLFVGASAVGGAAAGITQVLAFDEYRENNPWYAGKMPANQQAAWSMFVPFATLMSVFWGLVFAGLSWGLNTLLA